MRNPRPILWLLVALLSLPLACTRPAQRRASASPPTGPHIAWHACTPKGWQCGTLAVPLDYSQPDGPKIEIALNRLPASDRSHRIGSLLVNPGGPGASGVQFARDNVDLYAALTPNFDLVGFDPRGIGSSTAVKCLSDSQMDAFNAADPVPDDPGERQTLIDEAKALAAGCASGSGSLLAHVDTVSAARDMDLIRQALGESKLTYFGFSYGTYLGDTYAHLFPTHVRALVLDSVVDPNLDETQLIEVQAAGFERDLDDYLASCVSKPSSCPFQTSDPTTELTAFLERVDRSPIAVGDRQLNSSLAMTGIAFTLYDSPSSWPILSLALSHAFAGDGAALLDLADQYLGRDSNGHYDNEIEANYAVNCLDHPVSTSLGYFDQLAAELPKLAPIFGPFTAYSDLPCAYWPAPATGSPQPLDAPGAPPIVLVGNTNDPATPYIWAQAVHRQLSGSILITRTGDGHGGYPASSCVQRLVNAYLLNLVVPADGQTCPSD